MLRELGRVEERSVAGAGAGAAARGGGGPMSGARWSLALAAGVRADRLLAGTTTDAESRPLTVVLFDVSRSTRDPPIRARYLAAFEQVVDAAASAHGTVVGDVIDDNPLAHSSYPIDGTFDGVRPAHRQQAGVRRGRARTPRPRSTSSAEQILAETQTAPGTDIQDAVPLAQRVFDAYPRRLATLAGAALGHGRAHEARQRRRDGLRRTEPRPRRSTGSPTQGAIPDLTGVRVYVVGPAWSARPSSRPRGSWRSSGSGLGSSPMRTPT